MSVHSSTIHPVVVEIFQSEEVLDRLTVAISKAKPKHFFWNALYKDVPVNLSTHCCCHADSHSFLLAVHLISTLQYLFDQTGLSFST